jgi:hypothetical protein
MEEEAVHPTGGPEAENDKDGQSKICPSEACPPWATSSK